MIEIIKIEPKNTDSIKFLCEITKKIWREYFADFLSEKNIENLIYFIDVNIIKDEIALDNYNYYFIKKNTNTIGYFELHKKEDFLILSQFYLFKEYEQESLISEIFGYIKNINTNSDTKTIKVYPLKQNVKLTGIFNRLGFQKGEETVIYMGSKTYLDTVEMQYFNYNNKNPLNN